MVGEIDTIYAIKFGAPGVRQYKIYTRSMDYTLTIPLDESYLQYQYCTVVPVQLTVFLN
jgi:hypothetical protein